jgi:hypothetical protein
LLFRANDKLLADNYLSQDMMLTENLHAGSKEFANGKSYSKSELPSTLV